MLMAILSQVHWMIPRMILDATSWRIPLICFTSTPQCYSLAYFTQQTAIYELTASLRHVHWMTPKWPSTQQGQRYLIYVALLPPITPKFQSVLLFRLAVLASTLRKVQQMTSKWSWTLRSQRYPIYLPLRPKYNFFSLLYSHSRVTGPFQIIASHDLKMILNTMRSRLPYTSAPESQISICFPQQPVVFMF